MKKIGFIGAYDKMDLIMYVAKILTICGRKVLVVDSTVNQKARYIVPAVESTAAYVTDFQDIDFAIGFKNQAQIEEYLTQNVKTEYDIMLVDIDNPYNVQGYGLEQANINYFVTGNDLFSIKRGVQIISLVEKPLNLTKVVFSQFMTKEESEYIEYLSLGHKIVWNEETIFFPLGNDDWAVIAENERSAKISLKKLSSEYKISLLTIIDEIDNQIGKSRINKEIRKL